MKLRPRVGAKMRARERVRRLVSIGGTVSLIQVDYVEAHKVNLARQYNDTITSIW